MVQITGSFEPGSQNSFPIISDIDVLRIYVFPFSVPLSDIRLESIHAKKRFMHQMVVYLLSTLLENSRVRTVSIATNMLIGCHNRGLLFSASCVGNEPTPEAKSGWAGPISSVCSLC
jgi:hypothetical protein